MSRGSAESDCTVSYTHSHAPMCAFPYGHTSVLLVFRFHLVHKLLSTCHEFGRCQLAHAPILHLPSAQHQSLVLRGMQGHQEQEALLHVPNMILTQPMATHVYIATSSYRGYYQTLPLRAFLWRHWHSSTLFFFYIYIYIYIHVDRYIVCYALAFLISSHVYTYLEGILSALQGGGGGE